MQHEPFFALAPYHIALVVVGLVVIAAQWLPRLVSSREPAAAPLMLLFGAAVALIPGVPQIPDPRTTPLPWQNLS